MMVDKSANGLKGRVIITTHINQLSTSLSRVKNRRIKITYIVKTKGLSILSLNNSKL